MSPADWCCRGDALAQTRRALRMARDLQLDGHAIAVVMALLVEIERLRARRRRR
ncbi:MAG: chaperone modulator CbpM [Leptothrix sp. (in: b-proteobacteria)]